MTPLYNRDMFGNYPVNDDWIFLWQVKAFTMGIFKINADLDPSFVAQGLLGLFWSKVFGLSYVSLQALTFLISLATAFVVYKILTLIKTKKIFAIAGALTLLFNPLFFVSSFSFMTENYLLFFLSTSSYFFIKFFINSSYRDLLLGSVFGLLATMTRQNGFLIFLPVIPIILLNKQKEYRKKIIKTSIVPILFAVLSLALSFLWPKFGSNGRFLEFKDFGIRLRSSLYFPQYFFIFLSPVFLGIRGMLKSTKVKIVALVITLVSAYTLFKTDLFPLGNVFYIEELYAKPDFRSNFSLFDNIFTKSALALPWGFAFSKIVIFLFGKFRERKVLLSRVDAFLISSFALNLAILLISSDIYDRYLLPSLLFLLIFVFGKIGEGDRLSKKFVFFSITVFMFISVFLQWDFSAKNSLMWKQLENLREKTGLSKQISLNESYTNHISVRESGDFTGLKERGGGFDPICFIQDYTLGTSSPFFKRVENSTLFKRVKDPRPLDVRKKTIPRIKNNLDKLIYNEEYFSILYGAVGKKAYVGSFCIENT